MNKRKLNIKYYLKILIPFLLIGIASVIMDSCKRDQNNVDVELLKAQAVFKNAVKSHYNATVSIYRDGTSTLTYSDGKIVKIIPNYDGSITMRGNKINGKIFKITKLRGDEIVQNNGRNFRIEVIKELNNRKSVDKNKGTIQRVASPCAEHPSGENFDKCFKREWDDFCDGFDTCIARAVFPLQIAAAITIHCIRC